MDENEKQRWLQTMGEMYHLPNLSPAPAARPSGNPMGIRTKLVQEEAPKFHREYTAVLTEGVRVQIDYYTSGHNKRDSYGEMTQQDGRWVTFDPDRIADKILDPRLVPLVEAACEAIERMDRAWFASKPSEFVDEHGTVWRRA